MPDTFVPLVRPASGKEAGFAPLPLRVISSPAAPNAASENCREPVLTVQREGDRIKSIRIECGCGQVIDLACEY